MLRVADKNVSGPPPYLISCSPEKRTENALVQINIRTLDPFLRILASDSDFSFE